MEFYDPENLTDPAIIAQLKNERILQPAWDFMKIGREDALRSPMFPPMLAIVFYIGLTIPLTLVDYLSSRIDVLSFLRRFKIQKDKKVSGFMIWKTAVLLIWNHVIYIIPMSLVQLIWVPPTPLPEVAPTLWEFVSQQIIWFFVFDFEYWAFHVIHHKVRFLYRHVHAVHHQYHSPFALMTQHLHPLELFYVGFCVTVTPWMHNCHIMTYWSWFILSSYISIEVHTGYDLPFAAHNWLPIYGGAPKHDMHHQRPLSNFEPWMNYLDKLCGFDLTVKQVDELKAKKLAKLDLYTPAEDKNFEQFN